MSSKVPIKLYEYDADVDYGVRVECKTARKLGDSPLAVRLSVDVDGRYGGAAYLGPRDAERLAEWLRAWATGE